MLIEEPLLALATPRHALLLLVLILFQALKYMFHL